MKLSLNWIADFVDLSPVSLEELVKKLTLSTCEVEEVEQLYAFLDDVIVARLDSVEKHPEADRLHICQAFDGKKTIQVVTGAPGVEKGMLVALAPAGTVLPGKISGEPLRIEPTRLRGVESFGMFCSASELALQDFADFGEGLLSIENLAEQASPDPGTPLATLLPLKDTVLDIDNKSITHRPDLWSHFGFAREIAALFGLPVRFNPLETNFPAPDPAVESREIQIDPGAARAYFGLNVEGVRITESPVWMRARLLNVGQKPRNNVVDASNYVMFELGQPNHTFDRNRLKSSSIRVAKNGSGPNLKSFTTLDGEERALPSSAVLILDGSDDTSPAVALGGIMGGLNSGIEDTTTSLFLESATFHREDIRRTLSTMQLRTDSAIRFEKGQDPGKARPALARLFDLLTRSCPGLRAGVISGQEPEPAVRNRIQVRLDYLRDRLGFPMEEKTIEGILLSLGFELQLEKKKEPVYNITVPTYRSQYDITIPDDIVEELGRIYGYDNIEPVPPPVACSPAEPNRIRDFERWLKGAIRLQGSFHETMNYSFASSGDNRRFGFAGVELKNPVSSDRNELRVSLIPGLLRQGASNQDRYTDIRLFESGRLYLPENPNSSTGLPREEQRFALLHIPPHGQDRGIPDERSVFAHYLSLRGLVESLLEEATGRICSPTDISGEEEKQLPHLHPGCRAGYRDPEGRTMATVGILHPGWEKEFDFKRPAVIAEFHFDLLFPLSEEKRKSKDYTPPSVYPESSLEVTVLADDATSSSRVFHLIQDLKIEEIQKIEFLTVYRGAPLEEGKKALSYRVDCRRRDRTLEGAELQNILDRIVTELKKEGFPLR